MPAQVHVARRADWRMVCRGAIGWLCTEVDDFEKVGWSRILHVGVDLYQYSGARPTGLVAIKLNTLWRWAGNGYRMFADAGDPAGGTPGRRKLYYLPPSAQAFSVLRRP